MRNSSHSVGAGGCRKTIPNRRGHLVPDPPGVTRPRYITGQLSLPQPTLQRYNATTLAAVGHVIYPLQLGKLV